MKGMVAEKLLPYPCLMQEEGTGEERVFIYPCREQEEGTEEERVPEDEGLLPLLQ